MTITINNKMLLIFFILSYCFEHVISYSHYSYAISNESSADAAAGHCAVEPEIAEVYRNKHCLSFGRVPMKAGKERHKGLLSKAKLKNYKVLGSTSVTRGIERDPMINFELSVHKFIYGPKVDGDLEPEPTILSKLKNENSDDALAQFPTGHILRLVEKYSATKKSRKRWQKKLNILVQIIFNVFINVGLFHGLIVTILIYLYREIQTESAETFHDKTGVHLPMPEFMHRGHCRLNVTRDLMQTAVNAFAILLDGDIRDVRNLPPFYILSSVRTIAMMKIARGKLAAIWWVVKAKRKTVDIPYWILEAYRPLFKYVNGREMARLNLSDERILTFIGTHADVDRHQMGVVASRYMKLNPYWAEPKYMNLMNNVLCGVPMSYMRRINSNIYLQLTHQVFYHIRACDPMQRRFYLAMMTRTEALGKAYSWSASDVSRLGLLLVEVDGYQLATVNPEAMTGITAQVMLEMPPQSLQYITEAQLKYLGLKPLNILARKLKAYQDEFSLLDTGYVIHYSPWCGVLIFLSLLLY